MFTVNKEKLWKGFYQLRISQEFVKQWTDFVAVVDEHVKPAFVRPYFSNAYRATL